MDVSNEIQESLGRSYSVPDDVDEDELLCGKIEFELPLLIEINSIFVLWWRVLINMILCVDEILELYFCINNENMKFKLLILSFQWYTWFLFQTLCRIKMINHPSSNFHQGVHSWCDKFLCFLLCNVQTDAFIPSNQSMVIIIVLILMLSNMY